MRNSIVGKILMALIFVSVIGGISAGPALARNGDRGHGPAQRGWYDDRGRQWDRWTACVSAPWLLPPGTCLWSSAGLRCPGSVARHQHLPPLSVRHSIGESSTSIADCSRPPYSVPS